MSAGRSGAAPGSGPESATVRLPDGRRLGYAVYGDPDGAPVVFCHGTPGSRVGGRLLDAAAAARGVRVVAPDRPGHGLSTAQPGRTVRDWPADAAALVDALDVAAFGVVGLSGGGPYAAACAAAPALADRVAGAALVSAVPPPALRSRGPATRVLADLYGRAPWLGRAPLAVAGRLARDRPAAFVRLVARGLPDPDRALLDDPTVRTTLIDEVREATRGGAGGPALDGALLGRPWGFDPADVARPGRVTVYHGAADRTVAPGDARAFADAIPGADVRVVDGEGHLSTLVACAGAVLESAAGSIEGT